MRYPILSGPYAPSTSIIDSLESSSSTAALSAAQGKVLSERIDALGTVEFTVADIAARDALTGLTNGDMVFVEDATADPTVGSGWAIYRWNDNTSSFLKLNEQESLSVVGDPTNLTYVASSTNGLIESSTGDDATLPLASLSIAGLMSPNQFSNSHVPLSIGSGDQPFTLTGQSLQFDITSIPQLIAVNPDDRLLVDTGSGNTTASVGEVVRGALLTAMNDAGLTPAGTVTQSSAPANTSIFWIDSSSDPSTLKHYSGGSWVAATFEDVFASEYGDPDAIAAVEGNENVFSGKQTIESNEGLHFSNNHRITASDSSGFDFNLRANHDYDDTTAGMGSVVSEGFGGHIGFDLATGTWNVTSTPTLLSDDGAFDHSTLVGLEISPDTFKYKDLDVVYQNIEKNFNLNATGSGTRTFSIGKNRTAAGATYVSLYSDDASTLSGYLSRSSGADGPMTLANRGLGNMNLTTFGGSIKLRPNNSDVLVVTPSGTIGINRSVPTAELDVDGSAAVSVDLDVGGDVTTAGDLVFDNGIDDTFTIETTGNVLTIETGNVGITNTPLELDNTTEEAKIYGKRVFLEGDALGSSTGGLTNIDAYESHAVANGNDWAYAVSAAFADLNNDIIHGLEFTAKKYYDFKSKPATPLLRSTCLIDGNGAWLRMRTEAQDNGTFFTLGSDTVNINHVRFTNFKFQCLNTEFDLMHDTSFDSQVNFDNNFLNTTNFAVSTGSSDMTYVADQAFGILDNTTLSPACSYVFGQSTSTNIHSTTSIPTNTFEVGKTYRIKVVYRELFASGTNSKDTTLPIFYIKQKKQGGADNLLLTVNSPVDAVTRSVHVDWTPTADEIETGGASRLTRIWLEIPDLSYRDAHELQIEKFVIQDISTAVTTPVFDIVSASFSNIDNIYLVNTGSLAWCGSEQHDVVNFFFDKCFGSIKFDNEVPTLRHLNGSNLSVSNLIIFGSYINNSPVWDFQIQGTCDTVRFTNLASYPRGGCKHVLLIDQTHPNAITTNFWTKKFTNDRSMEGGIVFNVDDTAGFDHTTKARWARNHEFEGYGATKSGPLVKMTHNGTNAQLERINFNQYQLSYRTEPAAVLTESAPVKADPTAYLRDINFNACTFNHGTGEGPVPAQEVSAAIVSNVGALSVIGGSLRKRSNGSTYNTRYLVEFTEDVEGFIIYGVRMQPETAGIVKHPNLLVKSPFYEIGACPPFVNPNDFVNSPSRDLTGSFDTATGQLTVNNNWEGIDTEITGVDQQVRLFLHSSSDEYPIDGSGKIYYGWYWFNCVVFNDVNQSTFEIVDGSGSTTSIWDAGTTFTKDAGNNLSVKVLEKYT